uniref:Uncharacterized protein n=1 Tax=Tetranychus urticae TaxID=32264 RepID=T1K3I0_TETUR
MITYDHGINFSSEDELRRLRNWLQQQVVVESMKDSTTDMGKIDQSGNKIRRCTAPKPFQTLTECPTWSLKIKFMPGLRGSGTLFSQLWPTLPIS